MLENHNNTRDAYEKKAALPLLIMAGLLSGCAVQNGGAQVTGETQVTTGGTWDEYHMTADTKVTVTLNEKGKYQQTEDIFNLQYSDDRNDFPSDEVFAKFREVKGGELASGLLYRSASPCDNEYNRAPSSCFFEFIPDDPRTKDGSDGNEDEDANPKTLLIDELEQGKSYELVVTNQSGFYRYRMGDVIKVLGFYNESPMICFKDRKNNIVSVAGLISTTVDGMVTGSCLGVVPMADYGFVTPIINVYMTLGGACGTGISTVCGRIVGEGDLNIMLIPLAPNSAR
ncbi:MAG: GH3 auxin-responsive promoter family protein, partial [Lachnospiraceae bacterium]|nr:GH3 auxin-responsive promoter family protein [Lachnospiraceae bacterium]